MFESGMWIIYLEMVVVLLLGALIVWWTMPRKGRSPPDGAHKDGPAGKPSDKD